MSFDAEPPVGVLSYLSSSPRVPEQLRAETDPLHKPYRRLTLLVTLFALVSNLLLACFYHRLPDDALHLAWHLAFYTYFAIALSVIGFFGAKKGNATCVTIFANYMFIDIIVCTIPRLIAMTFFPQIRDIVCSSDSIHAFIQAQTESSAIAKDEALRLEFQGQCRRVVGVLQALAAILAVGATAVQVVLALRVSAYAGILQRQEDVSETFMSRSRSSSAADEKRTLEMERKSKGAATSTTAVSV